MNARDALLHDLHAAYGRLVERRKRRRRFVRLSAALSVGALLLAGVGLGAAALLGWPAPGHVKNEIAAVDRGLPEDLRLNPDVAHARAVAATGESTLYAADLRDGGHCTEIVTVGDRGRGATCATGSDLSGQAIEVTVPADEGAGNDAPVTVGGRVNTAAAASLEIVYGGSGMDRIPFGDERFFVFDVPAEHLASAHADGFELIARDAGGSVVARSSVPADWDDAAVPDEVAPLFVSTRSDESDFTKVYGIEGHVSAAGAVTLELEYAAGDRVSIPIEPDGSYDYTVPAERVDDFMRPRTLSARDRSGEIVATAPVAAVAFWRGRERGS
jgi:hypothetical protein